MYETTFGSGFGSQQIPQLAGARVVVVVVEVVDVVVVVEVLVVVELVVDVVVVVGSGSRFLGGEGSESQAITIIDSSSDSNRFILPPPSQCPRISD